ncbi:hypothetical protein Mgra_00008568 [Meloidogyne graminicola]|uniref:Uncharacterized protein n=1 Tax=Meloidogyne graminicola TaxID=189291 RepID=A0A8S9ZFG1_9BILA|nr:hypothetical protein Mgra_00008568 [Meloidogyne graminicola]
MSSFVKFFCNLLLILSLFIFLTNAMRLSLKRKRSQQVHPADNIPVLLEGLTAPPPSPEHPQINQTPPLQHEHLFQNLLTQGESSNQVMSPEITSPPRDSSAALLTDGLFHSTASLENVDNLIQPESEHVVDNRSLANQTPQNLNNLINNALRSLNEQENRPSKKPRLAKLTRCLSKMFKVHCLGGTKQK